MPVTGDASLGLTGGCCQHCILAEGDQPCYDGLLVDTGVVVSVLCSL